MVGKAAADGVGGEDRMERRRFFANHVRTKAVLAVDAKPSVGRLPTVREPCAIAPRDMQKQGFFPANARVFGRPAI
jgi:hypothetical protein